MDCKVLSLTRSLGGTMKGRATTAPVFRYSEAFTIEEIVENGNWVTFVVLGQDPMTFHKQNVRRVTGAPEIQNMARNFIQRIDDHSAILAIGGVSCLAA